MVIGNGLVATRFGSYKNNEKFLIFASGVSNSKTNKEQAYKRELVLLNEAMDNYSDKTLIYFSTCSISDPDEKSSRYVQHKLQIEKIIQAQVKNYNIFRVSNLAGNSINPNTVLNFFFNNVKQKTQFNLWGEACRNIIDIDDTYKIIDKILTDNLFPNQVINIANTINYPVKEIVKAIETFLSASSDYIEIKRGSCFRIDISLISPLLKKLKIKFDENYLTDLLEKYFKN